MQTAATQSQGFAATYRRSAPADASADVTTTNGPAVGGGGAADLEWLATNDPVRLASIALSSAEADPVTLAQVAQAMAKSSQAVLMTRVLLKLTEHARPFVREAALYGLEPFFSSSLEARERLREMAKSDSSPGVREAANELLLFI